MLPRLPLALLAFAAHATSQQALSTTFGPTLGALTGSRVAVGSDMDNDGVADLLVTSPGSGQGALHVVSGATNTVRTIANVAPFHVLLGTPDLNLDGRGDIVVDGNGLLRAFSGNTLTQLWQTTTNYTLATVIGDRNGDGRADLAAITTSGAAELRVLSGADGSLLSAFPLTNSGGETLVAIGDINGDGSPEVARGLQNAVEVLRLANPPLLLSIPVPGYTLGAANLAGDARNEIVAGETNSNATVRVLSATTGAVLRSWLDVPTGQFAVVGDLNGDAVPELALRGSFPTAAYDVRFVSVANGNELARWPANAQFRPETLAGGVDLNGDGFGDLLLGSSQANPNGITQSNPGGWQRVSGRILATMTSQPVACAQGPFFPTLGITRPLLGQPCTVAGQNAPANTVAFVAFSAQPAVPTNLGVVGCDAWFDLASGALLAQPVGVNWQFTFPVPLAPQLAGLPIAVQAFYAPTQSAIGLDVTNGIWARFGY